MILIKCPRCGSRKIEYCLNRAYWRCRKCHAKFDEAGILFEQCTDQEDKEATLTSTKGGFLVDQQMIKGGRMPRGSTNEGGRT